MKVNRGADLLAGFILIALLFLVAVSEWFGVSKADPLSAVLCVILLAVFAPWVSRSRLVFIACGSALALIAAFTQPDWADHVSAALRSAAFIAAFLTALTALRNAAETSAPIRKCGRFLARQRPGRRYLALTLGGHAFALVLSYGSLVLLGHIVNENVQQEENPQIRLHRTRRMLLAVQRGFVSTLPWSPLGLGMAISTTIIPGATWSGAVPACLVSAAILASTGWALDTAFKPRIRGVAPRLVYPEGGWSAVTPLLVLLAILIFVIVAVDLAVNLRIVSVILVVVPAISLCWIGLQNMMAADTAETLRRHFGKFVANDLPGFRSEFVLIMMAGFIGTLGAALVGPLLPSIGLDLSQVPGQIILLSLVWLIPLAGQIGMNPIMSVSIMAPLLPLPSQMGVAPNDIVLAITSGWALAGASSPFTATTVFIGAMGGVSPTRVGLVWNGPYVLICGVLLSVWVAIVA